ncbi:putative sensory transduction regulator [Fluviicoccus keumensis]|uniref:Putative sensory transduction regulator n=1 Tax=Fluviicoccus keumensis TaxID=1435465 RepID=A0A4Q7YNE9_9GAMM|nr:YbjN domain-containing protein [Fluviicoccus keumensis]RZU38165.1 putative sensory transduction regulator [Fluviicoccus keumensis]
MTSPNSLLDTVTGVLDQHELHYHLDDDNGMLSGSLRGDNGTWRFLVEVVERDTERGIIIVSFVPVNVPAPRRGAVAELLNRINFSKAMAFFAMDMSDGEIVCKSGFDLVDAELTPEMFDGTFLLNAHTLDHYLPAIMQVCFSAVAPEAAIAALDRQGSLMQ